MAAQSNALNIILLSIGFQCILLSICMHFSYGSWTQLQQSLSIIGISCLSVCFVLHQQLLPQSQQEETQNIDEFNISPQSSKQKIITTCDQSPPQKTIIVSEADKIENRQIANAAEGEERVSKRTDYLDWDEYFLSVAILSSMRSKDPSTQVGACIVNEHKRIVGIGYNGFPVGCSDDELPWNRKSKKGVNHTKYPYVCHAEMNAILNINSADCRGCTIYVVLFPCNECAKMIIQSGMKKIMFICDKYANTDSIIASKKLLKMAGIEFVQYFPKKKSINITFPDSYYCDIACLS